MAKRTPERVEYAKRLRAEGRSWPEVAVMVSKGGKPVSEAAIRQWLKSDTAPPAPVEKAQRAPAMAPPSAPEVVDGAKMTPEEFDAWLSDTLRELQDAAREAKAADDGPAHARATKLAAQLAPVMARMQARVLDSGDTVRVRVADMASAGERAVASLAAVAEAVLAEVAGWPRCTTCGAHRGEFAGGGSVVRALFERVVKGVVG